MKNRIGCFVLTVAFGLTGLMAGQEQATPQANGAGQEHGRRGQMDPAKQAQHMAKKLNLTADQQSQLVSILSERRDQVQSLRADTSLSQEDRHSRMQSIRSDSEGKIRGLLTDSQKQQYDQMQQEMRSRQHGEKAHGDAAGSQNQ